MSDKGSPEKGFSPAALRVALAQLESELLDLARRAHSLALFARDVGTGRYPTDEQQHDAT